MSVSKYRYTPEMCEGDFCIGDCDLCNKPLLFEEKEDTMNTWINARDSEPAQDGYYLVQMTGNYLAGISYTCEGGWNTNYDDNGELDSAHAIPSKSVARWLDAPQPPAIPQEWVNDWLGV